jgi:hypothetical protein
MMKEYVELIRVIVWPILIAFALFAFDQPIRQFLTDIGKRVSKLAAFGIELGLEPLVEGHIDALKGQFPQLEQGAAFPSTRTALLDQLSSTAQMDYAVIDLGRGDQWLTSRIFIFAILLKAKRDLRCFVFVESADGVGGKFIGTATPGQIRWSLAETFPWLEETFASKYALNSELGRKWTLSDGFTTQLATDLVVDFLRGIQIQDTQAPAPAREWVSLTMPGQPERWEHAEWLNDKSLRRCLGPALGRSAVVERENRPQQDLAQAVWGRNDPFVALLDPTGSFRALVQRLPGRTTES